MEDQLADRYKEKPAYILFENYILDTLGLIDAEKRSRLQALDIQRRFGTKAYVWREAVHEFLGLSDTIDIAILDLWHKNSDIAQEKGVEYSPEDFARNFVDEFYREGSKVDIWPDDALQLASQRVRVRAGGIIQ